jgi:hypothetical protein
VARHHRHEKPGWIQERGVLCQPVIRAGEWRETRAVSVIEGKLGHERARVGQEIGIGTKAATARGHRD